MQGFAAQDKSVDQINARLKKGSRHDEYCVDVEYESATRHYAHIDCPTGVDYIKT